MITNSKYQQYKKSGVDWLGDIPSEWKVVRSKTLFSQRKAKALPTDEQLTASQEFGIISQKDFMSKNGHRVVQVITGTDILKHVEPYDFVISMRSFQGGIELSRIRGSISSAYVAIIPSEKVEPQFFFYLFKSKTYIQALQGTTNLVRDGQALRFENFSLVDLPYLPLNEQRAIATFLDNRTNFINLIIKKQEYLIKYLQEKIQTLIIHAVTKGIDPKVKLKNSGDDLLGYIPEEWNVLPLKHAFVQAASDGSLIKGKLHSEFCDGLFPAFSASGQDVWVDTFKYDRPGIVLSAVGARCGKTFKADGCWTAIANTHSFFSSNGFSRDYVWYLSNNEKFWERGGTAQPFVLIHKTLLRKHAFPPLEIQNTIAKYLDAETLKINRMITLIRLQIDQLKEYRSCLVYSAVTGKIKV